MNCNELRDYYELYAMGVAEEPEKSEIRSHLSRECKICTQAMKEAREMTALLGGSAAAATPPARLRRRILASTGHEERGFGWAPVLAGLLAFSLVASIYFAGRVSDTKLELARATASLRGQNIELTRLREIFSIVNGADTTVSTFGEGNTAPPRGKVFASPTRGVLLVAGNLPPAPAGKAYEMWIIRRGKPLPAGTFQSGNDGGAVHIRLGRLEPGSETVAVTLEDAVGADTPTSTPLLTAPILGI